MECSIRFLMLPRHLSKETQKIIDTSLLEPTPEKTGEMIDTLRRDGIDPETVLHFERCAKIVLELRTLAARACGGRFDVRDYLACQALVLYGLMVIDRYPFETCACALGLIGDFLNKADYFAVA
jgi:hypothetical protein